MSIISIAALSVVLLLAACTPSDRVDVVRESGSSVMPFDLEATLHTFTKTEDGGVQSVEVREASDADNAALVRSHLRALRDEFAAGRFDQPAKIHGSDMTGLDELSSGASEIEVLYRETPKGAELIYRTKNMALVGALHGWFDAQVEDHGVDAVDGTSVHTMSREMWEAHHPGRMYPGDGLSTAPTQAK